MALLAAALVATVVLWGPVRERLRASELCDDLRGSSLFDAGTLIERATDEFPDIGQQVLEQCPEVVDALQRRLRNLQNDLGGVSSLVDSAALEAAQDFRTSACSQDGSRGTVTNNSTRTVDITIETQFLRDGTLTDTGVDFVNGLRPNQRAEWETRYFGSGNITNCRSEISRIRES